MALTKRYHPQTAESHWQQQWQLDGTYHYDAHSPAPTYSIDTPPPTVSGYLHLGHVYSYSHTDFMARFWRMNGRNVFYPMGYDDNGLPTERLVEKREQIRARDIGREAFIARCLAVSEEAEREYQTLWQRLGLSIDWRYSYRTIDAAARRTSQLSFLDLYHKGLAYRQQAPTIWCPECQTAIAQAELEDLNRQTMFYTLKFGLPDGRFLPIATTRPELLPACVALFVHPQDGRYTHLHGTSATVPLFGHTVPILTDPAADPQKGTGAVMCCTFGDTADVAWWHTHHLPLIEVIGRDGRLTALGGAAPHARYAGLTTSAARLQIIADIQAQGELLDQTAVSQSVRVHERCDTPVEYIVTPQWFIRVLDHKDAFLEAGERITWHPAHMKARYRQWVETLSWDWCISRQRYFGVTFPLWYCADCGAILPADPDDLPLDPTTSAPKRPCPHCHSREFRPETDVMDTWATSSLTPQIVGQWLGQPDLYQQVFPFALRPQAHEIIRTWAFYTIVKAHYHFGALPWQNVAISGWGLAPEGMGKISKSRGGGPIAPLEMIEQYSADAVRYWAASTGPGRDAIISEEKIQAGAKLVNKLWNVANFSQRFWQSDWAEREATDLTPADRWILARVQQMTAQVTTAWQQYDYATAKSDIEAFFWRDLADNYLEMVKQRLYEGQTNAAMGDGARLALFTALQQTVKWLAPLLPYVTEEIYRGLFARSAGESVHRSAWPVVDEGWLTETAVSHGEVLMALATAVRRYKSERNLSLGVELAELHLSTADPTLAAMLRASTADLRSISRAALLTIAAAPDPDLPLWAQVHEVGVGIRPILPPL